MIEPKLGVAKVVKWWDLNVEPHRESVEFPYEIPGITSALFVGALFVLSIYLWG